MKCIITVGISGSGKTSWAEAFVKNNENWQNISRDDLRFPDGDRDYYNYKFKKNKEKRITEEQQAEIRIASDLKRNIIISDTNLNKDRLDQMVKFVEDLGYEVEVKRFDIEIEEAIKRDNQRYGGVGTSVIMRQWLQLYGEKYERSKYLESANIFDVDGTIANMEGRSPFEWERVGEDSPIAHIVNIAEALYSNGSEIIFLSGRDGSCREETYRWLSTHTNVEFQLFMRDEGDQRKDYIVKEELFNKHIKGIYNVDGVFDDRPQVLRLWLKLGLPLLSVGNPYIEF